MLGRSNKCHFCGSKVNLSKCSCGKHFCPVHGVSGLCINCYSAGLVTSEASVRALDEENGLAVDGARKKARKETATRRKKEPPSLKAEIAFAPMDREGNVDSLVKNIRLHHFLCFANRRVAELDGGRELEILYHGDKTLNRMFLEESNLTLQTDMRQVSPRVLDALEGKLEEMRRYLARIAAGARYEVYRGLLHHNEFSWLVQTILLSKGARVTESKMEWELGDLPVRDYGPLCPWCGSAIVAQKGRCRFCGKDVPERISAGQFIASHLKRQFTDKIVGLKMLFNEGEMSPSNYRDRRTELLALKKAVERVRWNQNPEI